MDQLLKQCIEPVLSYLDIPRHVGYVLNAKKNVADMNKSMGHLKVKKTDVEKALKDAKRNKQQPTNEANRWLKEVAELVAKVAAANEDYELIQRRPPLHNFLLPNSWPSIHSCGSRAADFKGEAETLALNQPTALTTPMGPDRVQRIPGPSSYVGKAIEQNLDSLLNYLQDDTVGVVGIWGPGGVGKSTLLGGINNSLTGDGHLGFDYVIRVVASRPLQLEKLQKDIAERLELSSPSLIFDELENKNFLLLLDDLWEDFNLNEVGIPQPLCNNGQNQRKQKVVLTTRSEEVCSRMHVHKAIRVGCLGPAEALQLFKEAVGERLSSSPAEIEALKEEVAKQCGGLPLALVIIGKAMSNKTRVHQWKDTLRIMKSKPGKIEGMDKLFSSLKISYDNLADDTEKQCFLDCSLWPEDYNIGEEELVWCWLGHGRIDLAEFENLEDALDHGRAIIDKFKEACLLEPGPEWRPNSVKMHDVIRDLAVRVVGEKNWTWVAKTVKAEKANQVVAEWKEARKAYLEIEPEFGKVSAEGVLNLYVRHVRLQPPRSLNLSTLILRYSFGTMETDFLGFLPALTYLDFSYSGRQEHELPAVIGSLSHLVYLNFRCQMISGLPEELENLSELKYLILRLKDGIRIPNWVILKLQKLLVLDAETGVLETYKDPEEDYAVEDFYQALQRMKSVSVQEFKISSLGPLELLSHVKARRLFVSDLESERQKTFHLEVLSHGMQQIESLEISDCAALEKLVVDISCLPGLQSLFLKKLSMLREIIWRGIIPSVCLPLLRDLQIENCHELKDVSWVLQLPCLVSLTLSDCDRMEYVIADAQEANPTFLSLQGLDLDGLPQLRGICDRAVDFPSLSTVAVFNCAELKRLPFKLELADNKDISISGTQEWWDGLIWEDGRIKSALQLHFDCDDGEIVYVNAQGEVSAEE